MNATAETKRAYLALFRDENLIGNVAGNGGKVWMVPLDILS